MQSYGAPPPPPPAQAPAPAASPHTGARSQMIVDAPLIAPSILYHQFASRTPAHAQTST